MSSGLEVSNFNWEHAAGDHDGGVSFGVGFCISWQRGPLLIAGPNGALLLDVLSACRHQLSYYQASKFACPENAEALQALDVAIASLEARRARREAAGTLGTRQLDP